MRASETHRFLQESLLDIVVERLEKLCTPAHKLNRTSYQDHFVQLMTLLSEVIRISNEQSLYEKPKGSFFLSEGSDKVMRCAQILAFMMHNVEVPAVMRQTIKCAKLFFPLVDFRRLKLHRPTLEKPSEESKLQKTENEFLTETLKQIGSKISSAEPATEGGDQYVVYANINSSDEDFSFLVTALYHWETMYPTFTLELPKDPAEFVVKSPEKKPEEKKEEAPAEVSQPSGIEAVI